MSSTSSGVPPRAAVAHSESATSVPALETALRRLGHEAFRPGQREAIETLLANRRLLLVAPTGGGKSLVYQLPALLLPGPALVVSPLISLMQDQVAALEARGVRATFLASTLEPAELARRQREAAAGAFELVYAAPERLLAPGASEWVRALGCTLLAIDEAHCISEWGHDFRPEYLQLARLLRWLPDAHVLACTATATPVVRDEIVSRLGLDPGTPQIVRGFARPNLALRVREVSRRSERDGAVLSLLPRALGSPQAPRGAAIVYAPTRRSTDAFASLLQQRGWRVAAYHAGLAGEVRDDVSRRFARREIDVVVATNAFGMGIDRPDVRAVAHLAPPGSVEAYYQEVGRAGRDGDPAEGLLLVSPSDMAQRRALLERDAAVSGEETFRHKWSLFLELMRWAEGGSCRHDALLRYFGDEEETLAGCGRCDVCASLSSADAPDAEQVTLLVRQALSGVARIHGRFGLTAAAKLLRGASDPRLEQRGLHRTPTFGLLRDREEAWILRLLRRCITAGWVDLVGGERPVAVLTREGVEVMRAERPARLQLPPDARAGTRQRGPIRGDAAAAPPPGADALDEAGRRLFEALRHHRLEVSRAEGVPPYAVATDRALRDIAARRPRSRDELGRAHGIGPSKLRRYGEGLLAVVRAHGADAH